MTYEEALECMKKLSVILDLSDEYKQAMEIATESVEKQIPKKHGYAATKKYKNIFDGSEVVLQELESCPVCGFYPLETRYVRLHSCPKCNQRIDWGEES